MKQMVSQVRQAHLTSPTSKASYQKYSEPGRKIHSNM